MINLQCFALIDSMHAAALSDNGPIVRAPTALATMSNRRHTTAYQPGQRLDHKAWYRDQLDRQAFEEELQTRLAASTSPFVLLMFDVDGLEEIRECYGQDVADELLRQLAPLTRHNLREQDSLTRWEGDRFAALLPCLDLEAATALSEHLRRRVAKTCPLGLQVDLRLGIVESRFEDSADTIIDRANLALDNTQHYDHDALAVKTS